MYCPVVAERRLARASRLVELPKLRDDMPKLNFIALNRGALVPTNHTPNAGDLDQDEDECDKDGC